MRLLSDQLCQRVISLKLRNDAGQAMAEYALLLALITIACICAVSLLGVRDAQTLGPLP
jgi:Flp pilus assembly pilin Flp